MFQKQTNETINLSEDENLRTAPGAEKKSNRPTTPDEPVVPFRTCEQYKQYMAGEPDDNPRPKHNPAPDDGMTLSQLGHKSEGEILGIINRASLIPKKSDIRNMYANGYSFTWTDLTVIAKFLGFKITNPGEQNPHYIKDDVIEVSSSTNEQDGIIFIDHGKRKTVEKKIPLSESTVESLNELLGDRLCNAERSKVIDFIVAEAINRYLDAKKNGHFEVYYRPKDKEKLI